MRCCTTRSYKTCSDLLATKLRERKRERQNDYLGDSHGFVASLVESRDHSVSQRSDNADTIVTIQARGDWLLASVTHLMLCFKRPEENISIEYMYGDILRTSVAVKVTRQRSYLGRL